MQTQIDDAVNADFLDIMCLYKQLWPRWDLLDEEKLKAIYQTDLETGRRIYLVARDNDRVVGLCTLEIKDNIHYLRIGLIDELIVGKTYRNHGVGKMLLDKAVGLAKEKGCYRVELHSNIKRTDTHRFYESNGFEKNGYYFTKKC